MQQYHGKPAVRETREIHNRREYVSMEQKENYTDRRIAGEPAKFNSRNDHRRISWENDLYERQSV